MSKLIFIRGLPGAGKSTLAKRIKNNSKEKYSIVEPENVNLVSTEKDPIKNKNFKYRINLKSCIGYLEEGNNVIWAQPWRKMDGLNRTLDFIFELYSNPIELWMIEIAIKPEEAWERAKYKLEPHGYTWEKYFREYFMGKEPFILKHMKYIKVDQNQLKDILERLEL